MQLRQKNSITDGLHLVIVYISFYVFTDTGNGDKRSILLSNGVRALQHLCSEVYIHEYLDIFVF